MANLTFKQCCRKHEKLIKEGFTDYDLKQLYALQDNMEVETGRVHTTLKDMRTFLGIQVKDWRKDRVRRAKKWLKKSTD